MQQSGAEQATAAVTAPLAQLKAAIEAADLRVLLMVVYQMTAEPKWLSFKPKRDVKLVADEDAGLTAAERAEIRQAAFALLSPATPASPAIADPGNERMQVMMSVCLGEPVPPEYAPLMREELGFVSRDVTWHAKPGDVGRLPVLIIGAGVSGIALGARLERLGLPYNIVERHDDVGGVWLENRYPGAGVDTPNHAYSYSFGSTYPWSRYFSTRDEIFDYLRRSSIEFGVRSKIHFRTEVIAASWCEDTRSWCVHVRSPKGEQELQASILVSAIGQFGLPSIPALAGAETFAGPIFHSAQWPVGLDVKNKKVAVIGNGASAMQIVPTIVDDVERVTVFQRTPQWARPIARYHDNIGAARWLLDNVSLYAAWFRFTMWWRYGDGLLPVLRKDPTWPHPERSVNRRNDRHRVEMLEHIARELGGNTELIAQCTPDYPPFGKRILLDNGWYKAISKPQAQLVSIPVEKITPSGIVTQDGCERPADIIVYATGFQIAAMASRLNIRGRHNIDLASVWANDDPKAYLGIAVPEFPNFFMMQGPNTGLGHGGSAIFQAESQARYICAMVVRMLENHLIAVNVKTSALEEFVSRVDQEHAQLIWTHPGVFSYYRNQHGRVVSVMPFRLVDYWQMTREPELANYRLEPGKT